MKLVFSQEFKDELIDQSINFIIDSEDKGKETDLINLLLSTIETDCENVTGYFRLKLIGSDLTIIVNTSYYVTRFSFNFAPASIKNTIDLLCKEIEETILYYSNRRDYFMARFRNEHADDNSALSVDDRHEVFQGIMLGSSDFTQTVINNTLANYCAGNYNDLPFK